MSEGVAVLDGSLFYGSVVDGPQYPGVEGYGVRGHPARFVPCLVFFHCLGCYAVEEYVFSVAEFHEAVECGAVSLGCAGLAVVLEARDVVFHEIAEGVFAGMAVEFVYEVVCGVWESCCVEAAGNAREAFDVPADAFFE